LQAACLYLLLAQNLLDLLFASNVFVSFTGTECVGSVVCRQCICIFYWHRMCWTCCLQAVYLYLLLAQNVLDLLFAGSVFVSFTGTECVGPVVCRQCICIFYWHRMCWTCCLQAVYLYLLLAQNVLDLLFASSVFVSFTGTECVGPVVCRQRVCIFYWHRVCGTCCLQAACLYLLLAQSVWDLLFAGSVFTYFAGTEYYNLLELAHRQCIPGWPESANTTVEDHIASATVGRPSLSPA